MDWSDEGVLIAAKPFGETSAIAEILTREHGRHLGLVRGGRSRRMRPLLQPGNLLSVRWRARLLDHLGGFNLELIEARAARLLDDEAALAALRSTTSLVRLLPERDAHPYFYAATVELLQTLEARAAWPRLMVHWEILLLQELGFGLDLGECAITGGTSNLVYVSPRSGRAVSQGAGKPYSDKLLQLPAFLLDEETVPDQAEIALGLGLTGYFLERHVFGPQGLHLPNARTHLAAIFTQARSGGET